MVPTLISFGMIFKALQAQSFRIKIDSLGYKIQKFPEFNLYIIKTIFADSVSVGLSYNANLKWHMPTCVEICHAK